MITTEAITQYLENNDTNGLNNLLIQIKNKKIDLLLLIKELNDYLTAKELDKRSKGLLLLSDLLFRLPSWKLDDKELDLITDFLIKRIDDYSTISSVISVLYALFKHQTFINIKQITIILNKLHQSTTIQSLAQVARYSYFEIISIIIDQYIISIKDNELNFIKSFINAMDGEKDPRNLLLCFQIIYFILNELKSYLNDELLEEIYDITSCYYPITFTANKQINITPDLLKLHLRKCLSSSNVFAQWSLPLFMEKLQENDDVIKIDCLKSLSICILSYNHQFYSSYLYPLYQILKAMCLSSKKLISQHALDTVETITKQLCPNRIQGFINTSIIFYKDQFIIPLLNDCINELKIPDAKLSRDYGKILCTIAKSSYYSYKLVLEILWPEIITKIAYNTLDNITSNSNHITALLSFFKLLIQSNPLHDINLIHPLATYMDDFLYLLSQWYMLSNHSRHRNSIMQIWSLLATIPIQSNNISIQNSKELPKADYISKYLSPSSSNSNSNSSNKKKRQR